MLETTHAIDDMFHSKEMDDLFPGHDAILENRDLGQPSIDTDQDVKEIIVMEGDNDHFYNQELKELSKVKAKKPKPDFDLRFYN